MSLYFKRLFIMYWNDIIKIVDTVQIAGNVIETNLNIFILEPEKQEIRHQAFNWRHLLYPLRHAKKKKIYWGYLLLFLANTVLF